MAQDQSRKQSGLDILVMHDLPNVLASENVVGIAFWARTYVGQASKDGDADLRMGAVMTAFEGAGYTAVAAQGKAYKGDTSANVIQNTLVALAKGQLPEADTLAVSPQELAARNAQPVTRGVTAKNAFKMGA